MELNNMKISELREVARNRGLKGWTAVRRNDLREFLINNGVRKPSTSTPASEVLLDRIKKLEEENNELRQRQTIPTPIPI